MTKSGVLIRWEETWWWLNEKRKWIEVFGPAHIVLQRGDEWVQRDDPGAKKKLVSTFECLVIDKLWLPIDLKERSVNSPHDCSGSERMTDSGLILNRSELRIWGHVSRASFWLVRGLAVGLFAYAKFTIREGGGALVWVIPDTVSEEEVRRLDGGQLRQEGGGHRDGDVAGGRHAALVVHVPVSARRGGLKRCTDVSASSFPENVMFWGFLLRFPSLQWRCFTWTPGLWWWDTRPWWRCGRRWWTTPRSRNLRHKEAFRASSSSFQQNVHVHMHMYKQSPGTFNAGFYLILLISFFIDILFY